MIQKLTATLLLLVSSLSIFAQTEGDNLNRIVYNRIEYFFNTQQTDSIYNLASESFKEQISATDFSLVLRYFSQFGKIKEANAVTSDKGLVGYNIDFQTKKGYLQLAVDSTYRFNTFIIKEQPHATIDVKDINSNVTKTTSLDFHIDSIAKTYLTNATTASLAIGIVHNNKVNTFFYGETHKGDKNSLPTANSIYEIGSISKIFTSILLADLVEKNIISLDDSIAKFLPDSVRANPFIQKITFKQLANHTSGLPRLPSNLDKTIGFDINNPYKNYTRKELYQLLKGIELQNEPGDNYEYSNLGFGLLTDIISTITHKSYSQSVKDLISTPLGLTNTTEKIDPKTQQILPVYNEKGELVPVWDFQVLAGTVALKSTVNDLLRFAQYQFKMPENELENAMALTRQFTYYLPPTTDIGLGWHMEMSNDVITYWHNGGTGGSSSYIALVPDLKSAVIILSNSANSVDDISAKILDKVLTSK